MSFVKPAAEIITLLPPSTRLLCLDLGAKTIGLALSDLSRTIANPLETIRRAKFQADAHRLKTIVETHDIGGLVLGLPLNMNGSEGPRCQSTRDFARNLEPIINRSFTFWDERLSTAAVERVLIKEADMSRRRRSEVTDKMAATFILQGFLDFLGQNAR